MSVFLVDDQTPVEVLPTTAEGIVQVTSGAAFIAIDADPSQGVKVAGETLHFTAPAAAVTAISAIPGKTATIRTTGEPVFTVATGATAGTPGSFTPSGATPPADLAAMAGIVANPGTLWTVGQNVVMGDTNPTHWDGGAWVAGVAPA